MNDLQPAALNYAAKGWAVFPLKPNAKEPITKHGLKDASTDAATISQWWGKTPAANIGIACGVSQLLTVDLDMKDGKDGISEWARLSIAHRFERNGTRTSLTPTGGRHLLYAMPAAALGNSQEKLANGIDTRGAGGYIVAPPSVINGRAYKWEDETAPILPLPQPVIELLTRTEPEAPKDSWEIETLAHAREPRPPLEWLCNGVIAAGFLQIWYGVPSSLKTMLLQSLAVDIASGARWLCHPDGTGGFATIQAPVFWLDFDNGKRRTRERIAAFANARNLPNDAPIYYTSMPEPHLDAGNDTHMAALAGRVQAMKARLVVIDNLGVIIGDADENSAEVQRPLRGLRWLAETAGAAVIVIHHQRKSNGTKAREGETLRGHSSIEAKIDTALLVSRDGLLVTVKPTKERDASISPFSAELSCEQDKNKELTSARFWPAQAPDYEAEATNVIREKVIKALAGGPLSTTKLREKVKVRRERLDAELPLMRQDGVIESHPGPRKSFLWSLPSD